MEKTIRSIKKPMAGVETAIIKGCLNGYMSVNGNKIEDCEIPPGTFNISNGSLARLACLFLLMICGLSKKIIAAQYC